MRSTLAWKAAGNNHTWSPHSTHCWYTYVHEHTHKKDVSQMLLFIKPSKRGDKRGVEPTKQVIQTYADQVHIGYTP